MNHAKRIRPRLLPTLMVLILVPLFIRLGFWQLSRADEKRAMETLYVARGKLPSIQIDRVPLDVEALQYRPVYMQGYYDAGHNLLLDNRVEDGRVGYHVLTPLRDIHHTFAVLVDRGWVPGGEVRSVLPEIETPSSLVTVHGMMSHPDPKPYFSSAGHNREGKSWPAVVQWVDVSKLGQELGYAVQGAVIHLDKDAPNGFVRNWHKPDLQADRSTGYAMQWFSFAAIVLLLYIVLNFRRRSPEPDIESN